MIMYETIKTYELHDATVECDGTVVAENCEVEVGIKGDSSSRHIFHQEVGGLIGPGEMKNLGEFAKQTEDGIPQTVDIVATVEDPDLRTKLDIQKAIVYVGANDDGVIEFIAGDMDVTVLEP